MKNSTSPIRRQRASAEPAGDLLASLMRKVVGQPEAVRAIVPYVLMHQAQLSSEGRPVGVFLLLGPTGTGKTRTVEALAEVLHGSQRNILRINCGEYQMDHEVAKLIGAPPGYMGHRETPPMLSQQKLNAVTSEGCGLALVLFDEVEKAAPTLSRLLLGVLDKAILRLGDNTTVNFENSLIFLTSNLGARGIMSEIRPEFGFGAAVPQARPDLEGKLARIAKEAARRAFPPEFINRVDAFITYKPLGEEALATILDQHINELQEHVNRRLGERSFTVEVPLESRRFLLDEGTSAEYGARELKRTLYRRLTQPLAALVAGGSVPPGGTVRLELDSGQPCVRVCGSWEGEAA